MTDHKGGPVYKQYDSANEKSSAKPLLKRVPSGQIPDSGDLLSASKLRQHLTSLKDPPLSLLIVGDIMLAGRTRRLLKENGLEYPFEATLPILEQARIVVGNLEGPLTREPRRPTLRNYAYRVKPKLAMTLKKAGFTAMALANNHLLDCGRKGVLDTLEALAATGIAPLGAGMNEKAAHSPVILIADGKRVGLLNYYWNTRTAARGNLPGSARDTPSELKADIQGVKEQCDRVVIIFHWGIPYHAEPLPEDKTKARSTIDYGADAVVGHHPHVIQPFEIYRGRPIFYSIGNFAFGSGNSLAEGLIIGFRFEDDRMLVGVYPLYVKNRDPRVAYQPKALGGRGAERELSKLARSSGSSGRLLRIEKGMGKLDLPLTKKGPRPADSPGSTSLL